MTRRLTRVELDQAVCQSPNCSHIDHEELFIHSRCHPTVGLTVSYALGTGLLLVTCKECGTAIVEISVA